MKNVLVIAAQGGGIGKQIITAIKAQNIECEIIAVGTNSMATAAMLKAGADIAATGENPVIVACRTADIIVGPVGIVISDSLYGEITPGMAQAIGQCTGKRILIPINKCDNIIAGVDRKGNLGNYIDDAIQIIAELCRVD